MRDGVASRTSIAVSLCRSIGEGDVSADAYAHTWLRGAAGTVARATYGSSSGAKVCRQVARVASFGLVGHIVRRTHIVDRHVNDAAQAGIRQFVWLGAGLDSRAWRLESLRDSRVFEVDHPATQSYKRTVTQDERSLAQVEFVDVDFSIERFSTRLLASGFDPKRRSMWVWEGVTMYLPPDVVLDSIAQINDVTAPGSRIAASYIHVKSGVMTTSVGTALRAGFTVLGEPLRHSTTAEQLQAQFSDDWSVVDEPTGSLDERSWPARAYIRGEHVALLARTR